MRIAAIRLVAAAAMLGGCLPFGIQRTSPDHVQVRGQGRHLPVVWVDPLDGGEGVPELAAGPDGTVIMLQPPTGAVVQLSSTGGEPVVLAEGLVPGEQGRQGDRAASDGAGGLIVATGSALRRWPAIGPAETFAGGPPGNADGPWDQARFAAITDVARRADGTFVVMDAGNGALRTVDAEGRVGTRLRAPDTLDGVIAIDLDAEDRIVLGFRDGAIRRLGVGAELETLLSGRRSQDEPGDIETLGDLAVEPAGSIVAVDSESGRVVRLAADGRLSTILAPVEGPAPLERPVPDWLSPSKRVRRPAAVVVAPDGSIYVADPGLEEVLQIAPSGGVTRAWSPNATNGPPYGLVVEGGKLTLLTTGERLRFDHGNGAWAGEVVPWRQGRESRLGDGWGIARQRNGDILVSIPGEELVWRVRRDGRCEVAAAARESWKKAKDPRYLPIRQPGALAVGSDDAAYVHDRSSDEIWRLGDPTGPLVTDAYGTTRFAVRPDNSFLLVAPRWVGDPPPAQELTSEVHIPAFSLRSVEAGGRSTLWMPAAHLSLARSVAVGVDGRVVVAHDAPLSVLTRFGTDGTAVVEAEALVPSFESTAAPGFSLLRAPYRNPARAGAVAVDETGRIYFHDLGLDRLTAIW